MDTKGECCREVKLTRCLNYLRAVVFNIKRVIFAQDIEVPHSWKDCHNSLQQNQWDPNVARLQGSTQLNSALLLFSTGKVRSFFLPQVAQIKPDCRKSAYLGICIFYSTSVTCLQSHHDVKRDKASNTD
ncbi:hypothetical protein P5673_025146 [Acropora cervicornis]|uniref:Uncharacterized protein n=1 Tax=Acropora cervicornis TaxID=6130 RepID=A0AAD9Q2S5_ACRCE|nr:hypothetical protein P5673_025146 [Acropora cervicornis]